MAQPCIFTGNGSDKLLLLPGGQVLGLPGSPLCVQVGLENTISVVLLRVVVVVAPRSLPTSPTLARQVSEQGAALHKGAEEASCRKLQNPTWGGTWLNT